jgi:sugar phosphate isomerase/epimerase
MRISLCNEVLRHLDFSSQCRYAAAIGYDGLEIAPFTLDANPHRLSPGRIAELRSAAEGEGLAITGLHWLLITPPGLSVTSPDPEVRRRTLDVMKGLVDLCAGLGGQVMIHGSPKQRQIDGTDERADAEARACELWRQVAEHAGPAGVTYCLEPLSPAETNFINSLEEAARLVRRIDHPALRSMLDTKAVRTGERESPETLARRWLPAGVIAHVHVNDRNLRGPGQGDDRFAGLFAVLRELGYGGVIGVEPFDYFPDGSAAAARAIGYLRGLLEGLEWRSGLAGNATPKA